MENLQDEDDKRNKETLKTIEKHQKPLTDIIDNIPGKIFERSILTSSLYGLYS